MNSQDKEIFEKAIKLQNINRHKTALKILHSLESKYSKHSFLYGLMASSYYQIKDFEKSIKYFTKCLKQSPHSELASLGLFHSFVNIGKQKSAFLEMDRFLSTNKPKLYKVTLSELKENIENFTKDYERKVINKYSLNI